MTAKGNEKTAMGSWKASGSVQSVSEHYRKIMVAQGWKEELAQDMGDIAQFSYRKGQNQAMVTISKADQDVTIQVAFSSGTKTP